MRAIRFLPLLVFLVVCSKPTEKGQPLNPWAGEWTGTWTPYGTTGVAPVTITINQDSTGTGFGTITYHDPSPLWTKVENIDLELTIGQSVGPPFTAYLEGTGYWTRVINGVPTDYDANTIVGSIGPNTAYGRFTLWMGGSEYFTLEFSVDRVDDLTH